MAEISQATIDRVVRYYQELISVINLATDIEYKIFNNHGETEATDNDLIALSNVTVKATDSIKRLNAITIRIATIQPTVDIATANMLEEAFIFNEMNISAWIRSVEEIVNNWSLS
ncbi:hypothetical protein CAL7716_100960 (plasmid) [Calothrix sp. PCC 7716]|nr:hypothetical protein CAL7716_100960 [Calothrix sp. PCC 7716]